MYNFHKAIAFLLGIVGWCVTVPAQAQAREQEPAPPGRYIDGVISNVAGRIILYSDLAGRLEQARQGGETVTDAIACNELEDLLYQQLLLEQARIDAIPDEARSALSWMPHQLFRAASAGATSWKSSMERA